MIKKHRKKPILINAVKFTGRNWKEIFDWTKGKAKPDKLSDDGYASHLIVESPLLAQVGDFIIQGERGEFYPCEPNVFSKTYTPINLMYLVKHTKQHK